MHDVCSRFASCLLHRVNTPLVSLETVVSRRAYILLLMFLLVRPEAIAFKTDLCFTADVFFFFQREISDLRRLIPVKFCTMISSSQLLIDLLKYFKRSVVVVGELLIFLFI